LSRDLPQAAPRPPAAVASRVFLRGTPQRRYRSVLPARSLRLVQATAHSVSSRRAKPASC